MANREKIEETVAFIRQKTDFTPEYGIILGSGLGGLSEALDRHSEIAYDELPHFPAATVMGHAGKLLFGTLAGVPLVLMAGRFHYYEGYSMQQLTFPVRVLKKLGIRRLLVSNAAGSTNPDYQIGDVVFLDDHINLFPDNPLRGANDDRLGPRFPDMSSTYDRELNAKALELAAAHGIRAHTGVYAGVAGPNLETPAEYNYIHTIGGDVVGMSTVPEVLVARHMGLPVFAFSVVTDLGYPPEAIRPTTHEDVVAAATAVGPRLRGMVSELLIWLDRGADAVQ